MHDPEREMACIRHIQEAVKCLQGDDHAVTIARLEHAIDDLRKRLSDHGIAPPDQP